MKIFNFKIAGLLLAASTLVFAACKKSFLEVTPTDTIVDASFYQNDDQVLAGTAPLYSKVWFDFNDKASFNIEYRGGTIFSAWNDRGSVLFNTTGDDSHISEAWRSFFIVVAQSNQAIANINKYAGPAVTEPIRKHAIAEARFMRAVAYRYLVMHWGEVPIIENNEDHLMDTSIVKNTVPSIWRFITREMKAASQDLCPLQ